MSSPTPTSPFFVLGAQRSGTTMLRLMLNQHPHLVVPHETKFIVEFYHRLGAYGDLAVAANRTRLLHDMAAYDREKRCGHLDDIDDLLALPLTGYVDVVEAIMQRHLRAAGKRRWGDKTPYYTPDIDILWQLFPGCQIIHLVRDGRDVALSQRGLNWGSKSLPRLAEDWRWKTTLCHKVGQVLGSRHFLEIRYENLVQDPETVLRQVCAFLGESYYAELLDYPQKATAELPSTSLQWHRNSVRAPDTSKLYAWKHRLSAADRIIYEQVAGDALTLFGYERENQRSTWASKVKGLYYATWVRW